MLASQRPLHLQVALNHRHNKPHRYAAGPGAPVHLTDWPSCIVPSCPEELSRNCPTQSPFPPTRHTLDPHPQHDHHSNGPRKPSNTTFTKSKPPRLEPACTLPIRFRARQLTSNSTANPNCVFSSSDQCPKCATQLARHQTTSGRFQHHRPTTERSAIDLHPKPVRRRNQTPPPTRIQKPLKHAKP